MTVTSGSNYAAATAQTLPTGATPTATVSPVSGQVVTITFAQTSTSGSTPVTAYVVSRFAVGSSSGTPVSGSCAITAGTVTCSDSPGSGSWQYTDTSTIASSIWFGTPSAKSTTVVVQALTTTGVSATASSVVSSGVTPSAVLAGTTTTPAPGGSISFSVFGPQATAPTSCSGTGWSALGSAVPVTAAGTYNASAAYTPTTAGTYWWEAVYSGDTYNAGSSASCSVNSTVVHLALSPSTLPAATVYTAYSQAITASGGTAPYTYALTSGTLPTGLSVSSSGTLSGTISASGQSGNVSFVVTATDHAGLTGSTSYSLTVNAPTITLSSLSVTTTLATTAYAPAALTASGGVASYTYAVTSGSLPSGVTLSSSGALTGTPAAVSASTVYSFTVTATDAHSYTGSNSYSLKVVPFLTGTSLGTGSCSLVSLSACATGSLTTTSGATELVLIYTTGLLNPSLSSVSGPFTANATQVTSTSFSSGLLGVDGNDLYAYVATGNGASGTVSVNFAASLLSTTVVDVVQLAGNAPATAIVQHPAANGTSSPIKSTFSTPAAFDGEVVFVAAPGSTTLTPPAGITTGSGLDFDVYLIDPGGTSESFTMGSSGPWGSIGMEFAHN
jgi:hypothetical protein